MQSMYPVLISGLEKLSHKCCRAVEEIKVCCSFQRLGCAFGLALNITAGWRFWNQEHNVLRYCVFSEKQRDIPLMTKGNGSVPGEKVPHVSYHGFPCTRCRFTPLWANLVLPYARFHGVNSLCEECTLRELQLNLPSWTRRSFCIFFFFLFFPGLCNVTNHGEEHKNLPHKVYIAAFLVTC